jgi:hypothetical protein
MATYLPKQGSWIEEAMTARPNLITNSEAHNEPSLEIIGEAMPSQRVGRTSRAFVSAGIGFLTTTSAAAVFAATIAMIVPAKAQQLPHLNVDPVCRGIARHANSAGERGGPDLSFRSCVASQLQIRKRLSQNWSGFSAAAKANCIGGVNAGGLPSYTALLACLQIARAAASMRASTARTH